MSAPVAFLSLLIELAFGYPDRVFRAIGHPVTWIGAAITMLDDRLNRPERTVSERRAAGMLAVLLLVAVPLLIGMTIGVALRPFSWIGLAATALLASSLLAQRSLAKHVRDVADALDRDGIEGGRKAVSMIVGRDPDQLDQAGVCRAAIESLAENFSDGVTAPAFWLAIGGLGGGLAYKAVNTADSMIGHRTARYEAFGWAAARLDDLVNLPASRLTALLLVASAALTPGADARSAWRAVRRDARHHRSPNAGWPEAAMAGALGLALAGPRVYGGLLVPDAEMGVGGRRNATPVDIRRALRLYWTANAMLILLAGVVALSVTFA